MTNRSPVFVVSAIRSGSTMLRLMLDSHPRISNPGECDFLIEQMGDNGEMPDVGQFRRWLSVDRVFQARSLTVDPRLSYPQLIGSFVDQLRRRDVLTMNIHGHFERIPWLFPDARYIHLIRDPRDVARSSIGLGQAGNVYCGVDIWTAAERSWDRLASTLTPDRYLEIRYEVLVENTVEELTKICRFLDVTYSSSMLNYPSESTYAAPDANLKYQWKRHCSAQELQWIDWKLGSMLVQKQYEPSGFSPKKPTFVELMTLATQDKYRRVRFRMRRYGIGLYLENFLAARAQISTWRDSCQRRINKIDTKYLK